jgi:hypothetical protein
MATQTIKGRITAGTGDPQDLTATQVRTIINVADGADVTVSGVQTLTNKTLTTPTIADFTNATHAHTDAASGGTIPYLPLAGGTLTGELILDNLGVTFEASDTNPACESGDYSIYADLSETKFKTCTDGVVADIGSGGGGGSEFSDSAELAALVSDETGSGALVFGTAPTITLANGTGLPISTGVSGLGTGVNISCYPEHCKSCNRTHR